jgi:hypothetical protein
MTPSYNRNIFLYNKQDELTTYVELDVNQDLTGYYNLENNALTKFNLCKVKEKNKWYTDIKKAKIVFKEDCYLFHIFIDGEGLCKAIKKGSLTLESPQAESKVYSHNDKALEGYTISQGLMQDWLKKL